MAKPNSTIELSRISASAEALFRSGIPEIGTQTTWCRKQPPNKIEL